MDYSESCGRFESFGNELFHRSTRRMREVTMTESPDAIEMVERFQAGPRLRMRKAGGVMHHAPTYFRSASQILADHRSSAAGSVPSISRRAFGSVPE